MRGRTEGVRGWREHASSRASSKARARDTRDAAAAAAAPLWTPRRATNGRVLGDARPCEAIKGHVCRSKAHTWQAHTHSTCASSAHASHSRARMCAHAVQQGVGQAWGRRGAGVERVVWDRRGESCLCLVLVVGVVEVLDGGAARRAPERCV